MSRLKLSATHLFIYQFCSTESVSPLFSSCFTATGRQLHVPGQPRSRRAYLPAMRGKRPSVYDSVSFSFFFFKAAAVSPQVDCQAQLFLPSSSYIRVGQLVTTTRRLSLSISVSPSAIVKEATLLHAFT